MSGLFGFLGTLASTGGNVYSAALANKLAIANAGNQQAALNAQSVRYDYLALGALVFVGVMVWKKAG